MKRIIFTGIIAIISLFAFSSCSTLGKTCASAPFAYTEVHPNEIRADLNFNTSGKLEGTDYDMVINPQYETKRKRVLFGLWTRYTVTVKGYGAKVSRLYQADEPSVRQDIPLIRD